MFGTRCISLIKIGVTPYSSNMCNESASPSSGNPPTKIVSNLSEMKRVKKVAL